MPSLYETTYNEDGTIASFEPLYEDVPRTILKQVQMDLTNTFYPEKQIVPYIKVIIYGFTLSNIKHIKEIRQRLWVISTRATANNKWRQDYVK